MYCLDARDKSLFLPGVHHNNGPSAAKAWHRSLKDTPLPLKAEASVTVIAAPLAGIFASTFGSMPGVFGILHIRLLLCEEVADASIIVMSATFHR